MTAADVSGFLTRECPLHGAASARQLVAVVRSVLRYLHLAGLIAAPLEWAVPAVAAVQDRSLPRALEPAVVAALGQLVIAGGRSVGATTRSCYCWPGWGCAPARSLRSPFRTSIGVRARFWFMARAAGMTPCRCPSISARRW